MRWLSLVGLIVILLVSGCATSNPDRLEPAPRLYRPDVKIQSDREYRDTHTEYNNESILDRKPIWKLSSVRR